MWRVIDSWLQPRGTKVGRETQSPLQGDPTREGFQEEIIFKLRLEGCVAITQHRGGGGKGIPGRTKICLHRDEETSSPRGAGESGGRRRGPRGEAGRWVWHPCLGFWREMG